MTTTRITTLDAGYFDAIGDNETTLVSTKDDPPKHRLGVMRQEGWGRSLGCHSFNNVRPSGVEDEVVLVQGKVDDRFPLTSLAGEWRLDLRAPSGGDEGGMVGVCNAYHDKIIFKVPVYAPNLSIGMGQLVSPNNLYRLSMQDDGNLVVYNQQTDAPLWSWMTGPL